MALFGKRSYSTLVRLEGRATKEATAKFHEGAEGLPTAVIPKLGLTVSRIGVGGYRLNEASSDHFAAVSMALQKKVNVIDTSAHFEQGASERVIGSAIRSELENTTLKREDIVLISKAGYLTQTERRRLGLTDLEHVRINDDSAHSINPKFLESELNASLHRLGVESLDIFMINSPERMLSARNRGFSHKQLYQELARTFEFLHTEVKKGRISGFGITSNSIANPHAEDHISLSEITNAVSKAHLEHFVAVQAPYNVFERTLIDGVDGSGYTDYWETMKSLDLYQLTNRPLNAIHDGIIRTLANSSKEIDADEVDRRLEQLKNSFEKVTSLESDVSTDPENHFAAKHYLERQLLPAVDKDLRDLEEYANRVEEEQDRANFLVWKAQYEDSIHKLIQHLLAYAHLDTLRKNNDLDRVLGAVCPRLSQGADEANSPLSVKALRVALAQPQIGTVLTGMRTNAYVDDAILAAQLTAQSNTQLDDEDRETIAQCPMLN
ncbi:hypothetical protein BZG36_00448 [Bifiguratus adelaidae]|uniref:NADP-dependent oxidoreductase domain-containing protein n=1 Tax=Bifiguratus adelaidae TaxID=1938954 RepID=A0A261Y7N6_9FUNG|nr:hypothetical protein BZG36_00448 [Bifiguratus adelaidae]